MFPLRSPALALIAVLLCACPLAGGMPQGALAQTSADQPLAFDIPAQPLDAALAQYFRVSGVQLLYDSALTVGRRSTPVHGSLGPREALRRLLSGTGLIVRYSRASAAIITRPEVAVAAPLVPLGRVIVRERIVTRIAPVERMAYYGLIETQLRELLRSDKRTSRLVFDLRIALRIGENGGLEEIRVMRGSGDRRVDRALVDVLSNASVAAPPPGLKQPLAIALRGAAH